MCIGDLSKFQASRSAICLFAPTVHSPFPPSVQHKYPTRTTFWQLLNIFIYYQLLNKKDEIFLWLSPKAIFTDSKFAIRNPKYYRRWYFHRGFWPQFFQMFIMNKSAFSLVYTSLKKGLKTRGSLLNHSATNYPWKWKNPDKKFARIRVATWFAQVPFCLCLLCQTLIRHDCQACPLFLSSVWLPSSLLNPGPGRLPASSYK